MSVTPDSTSDLSRRTVLRRAAAAGLLATPAAGLLAACATGGTDDDGGGDGATTSNDNPFGVDDGSAVEVVVFNGGLGDEYPKFDKTLFEHKHAKANGQPELTQKIKTEQQPKFAATPADLINNAGADMMGNDVLVNEGALLDLDDLLDAPSWDDPASRYATPCCRHGRRRHPQGKFYALNYVVHASSASGTTARCSTRTAGPRRRRSTSSSRCAEDQGRRHRAVRATPACTRTTGAGRSWTGSGSSAAEQAMVDIDNLKDGAWKTDAVSQRSCPLEKLVTKAVHPAGLGGLTHTQSQQAFLDGKAAFLPVGTWLENEMSSPPTPGDDREPAGGRKIPPGFELTMLPVWDVTGSDKMPYGAASHLRRRVLDRADQGQEPAGRHGVPACHAVQGRRRQVLRADQGADGRSRAAPTR